MGMLDRYRRRGGFVQLLNLIESSPPQKRENFLGLISQESKIWETEIRKRILSFDRLIGWNPQYLSEIFTRIQPMNLAVAFHGADPAKTKHAFAGLSPTLLKKLELVNSERQPSPAEIFTCQVKILEEARQLIQKGILKLDKVDPELFIHDKIEEIIAEKETQQQGELGISSSSSNDSSLAESKKSADSTQTSTSSIHVVPRNDEKVFTEDDIKKVQELSSSLQNHQSSDSRERKTDSELFLKQIQQELSGIKNKIERLQNENSALKKDLEAAKSYETKIKEELSLIKKENQSLKIELSNSKSKLDQIRKIA